MLLFYVASVTNNISSISFKDTNMTTSDWLLFFYTIPAKPVGSRTKIWRKLTKMGAIKLKGTVYVIPYSEEHHEILQWLITEISSLGGDGALARTNSIEPLQPPDIINLFDRQCADRYQQLASRFDGLERNISLDNQSVKLGRGKKLATQLNKLQKEFYSIEKIDFFNSKPGHEIEIRMKKLKQLIVQLEERSQKTQTTSNHCKILPRNLKDYQEKTWITRTNPFVDRMASAWLIRKFVDPYAVFSFVNEVNSNCSKADVVTFDIRNGEFTHFEDLCTFEVLLISFELNDTALQRMSHIVHDIDLNDDKHRSPEAKGVEMILTGVRKSATTDVTTLEKGMDVFEALYTSLH